jgi:hypothetical protein
VEDHALEPQFASALLVGLPLVAQKNVSSRLVNSGVHLS